MSVITRAIGIAKRVKHRFQDEIRRRTPVYLSPVRRIERVALPDRVCSMTFVDGPCRLTADPSKDGKTLIKNCSKGMRQRAALGAALVHQPELLFLDEPTSGLDPAARAEVHKMLAELRQRGTTVFLTTHDMAEAETVCQRVAILNAGAIVACDQPEELKLRYARNRITVRTRTRGRLELSKSCESARQLEQLFAENEVLSVHSDEPNLEEVFLELTGREF